MVKSIARYVKWVGGSSKGRRHFWEKRILWHQFLLIHEPRIHFVMIHDFVMIHAFVMIHDLHHNNQLSVEYFKKYFMVILDEGRVEGGARRGAW